MRVRVAKPSPDHFFGHGWWGSEAAKICCPHLEVRCHVRGLMSNLSPPSAVLIKDSPALPMEPTVLMAADAVPPQTGPLGDPLPNVTGPLSNGPGTRVVELGMTVAVRVGRGKGLGFGDGQQGLYPAGRNGVTTPRRN